MIRKAIILAALTLSGCAEKQYENAVKSLLVDPDSAKFNETHVSEDKRVACGSVNSKNRMGGYSGDMSFMIVDGTVWLPDEKNSDIAISECCFSTLSKQKKVAYNKLMEDLQESCKELSPAPVIHRNP